MQKIIKSDKKIKYTLLSVIFLILFMVTTISYPINIYAVTGASSGDEPAIGQTQNLTQYAANETDQSAQQKAGYLYCAASENRCGVLFYVVDNNGELRARGLLMDPRALVYDSAYATNTNTRLLSARSGFGATGIRVEYVDGASPVYYNDTTGWNARGSAVMNYLTAVETVGGKPKKIDINGVKLDCPRWATYVLQTEGGPEAIKEIAKPETEWQLFLEPVSTNYLYTTNRFTTEVDNTIANHNDFTVDHYVH